MFEATSHCQILFRIASRSGPDLSLPACFLRRSASFANHSSNDCFTSCSHRYGPPSIGSGEQNNLISPGLNPEIKIRFVPLDATGDLLCVGVGRLRKCRRGTERPISKGVAEIGKAPAHVAL
jgi:hypothetical protein